MTNIYNKIPIYSYTREYTREFDNHDTKCSYISLEIPKLEPIEHPSGLP